MQYLPKIIVGLVAAVQLAAVALPSSASAEQLKKIAILPKTLVNDVFQIRIVKAAEGEAKKDGIATEHSPLEIMLPLRIKLILSRH